MKSILVAILVLAGAGCLAVSLPPIRKIATASRGRERYWQVLGLLVVFFIAGYFVFMFHALGHQADNVDMVVAMILGGGGLFVALVARVSQLTIGDISRITALERHRALHDPLTDLPNRGLLLENIDSAIAAADMDSRSFAVVILDIDRFKEINDALGPHYGDYLLQLVTPRICQAVRGTDTVARIGGDEFAVLLADVDREGLAAACRKIVAAFGEPFAIEGHSITINVSVGAALYPDSGREGELLLQRAEIAMYACKDSGRGFVVYSGRHDSFSFDNLIMVNRLREDIGRSDAMEVFYQPKVSAGDRVLAGVEALVRWRVGGRRKMLLPGEFIDLAEQSGLICNLSRVVLEQTFARQAAWREEGIDLPVSVNISVRDLRNPEIVVLVRQLLDQSGLDPASFLFEITERSMIHDSENTHRVIYELHRLGISFSIDDFGTGYSSLSVLKQLPVREIKIDKSFVLDMLVDRDDRAIVLSTINLAGNLGLRVVAEGVENERIADELTANGCDLLQGHFICPPLPADEMLAYCRDHGIEPRAA